MSAQLFFATRERDVQVPRSGHDVDSILFERACAVGRTIVERLGIPTPAPTHGVSRLPRALQLVRRRYFITSVAVAGIVVTWSAMIAFSWSVKLGIITLAPWVALLGFDLGVLAGVGGAAGATALWLVASDADSASLDATQIVVRTGSLLALAVGSALAGRRLRESEVAHRAVASLQSSLIDATLDGICLTDADGNILIVNRQLRKFVVELGMAQEGTVTERLLSLADEITEPERFRKRMLELADAPGAASTDEFEIARTGRVFRGYTAPVPHTAEATGGRIWTLREVTADRELDRMRDAFVATVSHELRTPLTSISGFLEMMQDEEQGLGTAGRQYLDVIRRSTDRLHSLVEDLLLVAQIEANRIELDVAPTDLALLARSAAESARPSASERGVAVEVVVDHPPSVLVDARRVNQVLDNLISNAVKFSSDGGRVVVTVTEDGDGGRVTVSDDGIGIPAEEQAQIFSRFFRASTATSRAIPGTGLGLAISRALVEQHGGTISLASREGGGTSVSVSLPAATAAPARIAQ